MNQPGEHQRLLRAKYAERRFRAQQEWTDEELRLLEEMVKAGTPVPTMADRLGRSREAVRGRAQKAGLMPIRARKAAIQITNQV